MLTVCDTSRAALEALRETRPFREVPPDAICDVECELFAPCAIGGATDTDTAKRIKASVVAGSANNILSGPEAGATLMARGITYAPDFLVNAGALVQGVRFLLKGERRSPDAILDIGMRTTQLLEKARMGMYRPRLFSSDIAKIEFRVVFLAVTVKNSNVRNSEKCQLRSWDFGFIIEHAFQTFAAERKPKSGQYCEKHHLDLVDLGTRQGIRRQIASCRPGRRYAVQYIGAVRTAADAYCAARRRRNCRGARSGAGEGALFCRQRRRDSPVFKNAQ